MKETLSCSHAAARSRADHHCFNPKAICPSSSYPQSSLEAAISFQIILSSGNRTLQKKHSPTFTQYTRSLELPKGKKKRKAQDTQMVAFELKDSTEHRHLKSYTPSSSQVWPQDSCWPWHLTLQVFSGCPIWPASYVMEFTQHLCKFTGEVHGILWLVINLKVK